MSSLNPANVKDMPKTGIKRMIENEIPNDDLRISNHSLNAFHHGMREMLNLLSKEIVAICAKTNRTIVTAGIIISAIQNLGFDEHIEDLKHFAKLKAIEEQQKRKKKKRNKKSSATEMDQELIDEQERLIREATQKLYGNTKQLNSINAACRVDNEQNKMKNKKEFQFKAVGIHDNENNDNNNNDDNDDNHSSSDSDSDQSIEDESSDSESESEDDDMNGNKIKSENTNTGFKLALPSAS